MKADDQTLARIYEEYAPRVRNFLFSKTHDSYLSEELTAEVFAKVCEKIEDYDENKAALSTWIFTIANRKLIDYYRARRITTEVPEDIQSGENIEEAVCTEESLEELAAALEGLDDRKRTIIVQHYYHKCTLRDISFGLGISYSYVKVLHKDALRELRIALGERG